MILSGLLLVLLLSSKLLDHNGAEGTKHLSEREDEELEKQLKLLNKPAIKTIHVRNSLTIILLKAIQGKMYNVHWTNFQFSWD